MAADTLSLSRIKDAVSYCAHCCQDGSVSVSRQRLMEWREGLRAALDAPEADRLRAGITEVIAVCEQDARDQDHNAGTTGFGPGSKAYVEGRGTACRGIAARLRALLAAPSS